MICLQCKIRPFWYTWGWGGSAGSEEVL